MTNEQIVKVIDNKKREIAAQKQKLVVAETKVETNKADLEKLYEEARELGIEPEKISEEIENLKAKEKKYADEIASLIEEIEAI